MILKRLKKGIVLSLSILAITSSLGVTAFANTSVSESASNSNISTISSKDAVINAYMSTVKNKSNQSEIQKYISELDYKKDFDYDSELQRISQEYKEGDILNEKDTKILFESSILEAEKEKAGSSSRSIPSKTLTKFNTKVTLSGTMYQNIAAVAGTNTYRGYVKLVRNSGKSSQVRMTTYHSGFGGAGWNGNFPEVGLIHNGNVSHTQKSTGSSYGMDKTNRYNGVVIFYTSMWSKATVTAGSGQAFDIASSTWKRFH